MEIFPEICKIFYQGKKLKRNSGFFGVLKNYQLYMMLVPGAVFIFIFNYIPIYGVQIAFRDYYASLGFYRSPWVGFENFRRFFSSPDMGMILYNTLFISIYALIIGFPLPIILSLLLNYSPSEKLKKLVQNITYAPRFISVVVLVGIMLVFFAPSGAGSKILTAFGVNSRLIMGTSVYFPHIYVWSGIWQNMGWDSIIYLAVLSGVDPELHEAAIVDGANILNRIFHIDIPYVLPTAIILLVLSVGSIMNVGFEKVYLMQNSLNLTRSEVIATYVYKMGLLNSDYSYAAAVSLFNNIINFSLLVLVNKIARKFSGYGLW